jgi:hypothetical protein
MKLISYKENLYMKNTILAISFITALVFAS